MCLSVFLFLAVFCGASSLRVDTLIKTSNSYYLVQESRCGFVQSDTVFHCHRHSSSLFNRQFFCTRQNKKLDTYQMYWVESYNKAFYCRIPSDAYVKEFSWKILKGYCCKSLEECSTIEMKPKDLAVVQTEEECDEDREDNPTTTNEDDFNLKFYQMMTSLYPMENVMVCPACVMHSLGILMEGARGNTRTQLQNLLGQSYNNSLYWGQNTRDYQTHSAVFYEATKKLRGSFERAAQKLGVDVIPTEFNNYPYLASLRIDNWLTEHANITLDALNKKGGTTGFNEQSNLAIGSTLNFTGKLQHPFNQRNQGIEEFTTEDGKTYRVLMMNMKEPARLNTMHDRELGVNVIELPFANSTLSLILLLPDRERLVQDIEQRITTDFLKKLPRRMKKEHIYLTMPKIQNKYSNNLNNAIQKMGAFDLFENPDLSGIFEDSNQRVSFDQFTHASVFTLDNKRAEISAAAVGNLLTLQGSPRHIRCDRPFFFLIHDQYSQLNILMGRVVR